MPKKLYDWAAIQRFHDDGHGFVECQKRFGFSHTAWIKAIKRGTLRSTDAIFEDRRRKHDWPAIQAYYDEGHSYRECQARFGFAAQSWQKARLRGEIRTRPLGMPLAELLSRPGCRHNVKLRLLRAGLLGDCCQTCGVSQWLGKPLSLHLDHINGKNRDHRLENLRLLCPNCHSQTHTYGGRNVKRRRALQEQGQVM